jgi:hypothetical protein
MPSYFQSQFCVAELRTFHAREERPIVPILFRGPIPEEFRSFQIANFGEFAYAGEAFKATPRYIDFQNAVQKLSPVVADAIRRAPPFDPDSPVLSPADVDVWPAGWANRRPPVM